MRLSEYFLPLLRENPSEAQIVSHRLMLRAGMVRQSSAGPSFARVTELGARSTVTNPGKCFSGVVIRVGRGGCCAWVDAHVLSMGEGKTLACH